MKKAFKFILLSMIILVVLILFTVVFANIQINLKTKDVIFDSVDDISFNKVGLVLGTSKYLSKGRLNLYFKYRIDAVCELYNKGKIEFIVVSGDNSRKTYNEPEDMRQELIKRGIPEKVIYLDYAGFRTFDSVYRMNAIFEQSEFTIVSQKFHNQRAVFIAKKLGLNAIAYNAKDVHGPAGLKTQVREKLARVKVYIDLISNKKPKFLGAKIEIF